MRYGHTFLGACVLASLTFAADPALAQAEAAYPSLIKELAPGYELTAGEFPAILGIRPGMTVAEVEAIVQPLANEALNYPDQIQEVSDPRDGRTFSFLYRTSLYASLTPPVEGSSDSLSVLYTTDLTGGRVKGLTRSLIHTFTPPDQMPNFDGTLDAIVASYGQPSFRRDEDTFSVLYYLYWNGTLDQSGSDARLQQCTYLSQAVYYSFKQDRTDPYPDCTALVEITANRDYRISKSLLSLEVEMTDHRRAYDDAVVADQYLLDGLAAAEELTNGPEVKL